MKTLSFFSRSDLTRSLWAFRREFLMVGLYSLVANVLMLAPTLYMLQVYDRVLVSQSELTLLAISLLTLFLFGVMAFAEWMRSRLLVHTGVRLDERLSTQVFNASFEANLNQSGHAAARSFGDLIQIRQFLTGNGIFAFFDVPWAPIYLAVLYFLHPWLGAIGVLFALVQGALAWVGHRVAAQPSENATKAASDAGVFLQGKLRNAEVLESMGMIQNLQVLWQSRHQQQLGLGGLAQRLTHHITAWSKFIRYSQQSLALGAGALLVIDGQLSPGAMIAANVLMTRALAPIDQLVGSWRQFMGMRTAFGRLEQLLKDFPARAGTHAQDELAGQVTLRGVSAGATGRAQPILKGIDLQVPAGTVMVIAGPSGSGKSTLARVLVGIWPHVSGDVLLDGVAIKAWDRAALGSQIGYLPQDIELFEGTIAENIARFGDIDSDRVIAAAQQASLHDMILRFPKGYDTPMGEAGNLLSGGQRQRIALARAVYGNPALLVLDEPNANLDDVGEAALYQTVAQLKAAGKTVFLITHRPGAVALADRVLLLRDGQVQAEGPREAVIESLQAARGAQVAPQAAGPQAPVSPA
jgi:ATP-binding cassette, subfamily C, bacterial exporter for protease/lipase